MVEAVLNGIVQTALPVLVWVCCINAVMRYHLTDYLTEVQADLTIAHSL